jgi:hypothetical protein
MLLISHFSEREEERERRRERERERERVEHINTLIPML